MHHNPLGHGLVSHFDFSKYKSWFKQTVVFKQSLHCVLNLPKEFYGDNFGLAILGCMYVCILGNINQSIILWKYHVNFYYRKANMKTDQKLNSTNKITMRTLV